MSTTAGTWTDAGVTAPPKDESSYLRLARVDDLVAPVIENDGTF
jgi:hypothetical protein